MSILQTKHLEKVYSGRKVVKDISISVGTDEITGLLGPNGAGKTTSFYIIVGLISPSNGQIFLDFLDDENITRVPMYKRARLGISYLPQEASIFRKLSVADNIMAILELRKDLTKDQRQKELENLLEEFHITHLYNSMGMSLSGGERRRVEIARTLATDPKFILLKTSPN